MQNTLLGLSHAEFPCKVLQSSCIAFLQDFIVILLTSCKIHQDFARILHLARILAAFLHDLA